MPKHNSPIRRQKPVKGGREQLAPSVLKEIRRAVEHMALQHRCSKSLVVSVALADYFGIKEQEKL